ncbi:MAG: GNAT family N-acetyltransferase [Kiloniellales bacterium]|nr:GNAT family N-acetyltransferase [Kiloniellales bacterium]
MVLLEAKGERPVDVEAGNLTIRLAETAAEVRASQELRFRVFCEEMTAKPSAEMVLLKQEFDSYDAYCDHLLVFDRRRGVGPQSVIGSYRLMRRAGAKARGQFYTADEYDISKLLRYDGEVLELGRSCVDPAYRTGSTMQLLWRGIAEYVFHYGVDLMFGCASLHGTDPKSLALPLAYLHYNHLAPEALRTRAVPERYVAMDLMPAEAVDTKAALKQLPPLVKGYLRLGGFVGDGAVVDEDFGTTDICVIVKTDGVTEKYYRHYARDEAARP